MSLNWLDDEKYVLLETYRMNGTPVRTPVWFVRMNDNLLVVTRKNTGKIKRLMKNTRARIAPCTIRGTLKGDWVTCTAELLNATRTSEAIILRNKRYGFMARLANTLSKGKGDPIALLIKTA